jgi:hypothetical protein
VSEPKGLRGSLVGKALDPSRPLTARELEGDMHWMKEVRRQGSGRRNDDTGLREVTAEDRGKSGHGLGVAVRVSWCGAESEASIKSGWAADRSRAKSRLKMTQNRAAVTCVECIEAELKHHELESGACET